ncbi:hypothetical protein ACO0K3_16485 [Undibacterium sp. Rencai35W]|uniref:hypothetical protein n=1 Tax=Undibacterium sp. Rencai35W TaxID=3413046 RepID=UPI003BF07225
MLLALRKQNGKPISKNTSFAKLLFFVTASFAVTSVYAGWQDTPDTLSVQAVGEDMQLNGTPMKIRAFTTDLPMETVLKQVQDSWERARDHNVVTRSKVGTWTVLNQTVGNEHRSFQIKETAPSRTEGYVALTSPQLKREPKLAVRLPNDMQSISIIDSIDQGRISQQVIAVSPRSVDATANALEASLKASGWERHAFKKNGNSILLSANKGTQEFDATLSGQKAGSLVMMNTIIQGK